MRLWEYLNTPVSNAKMTEVIFWLVVALGLSLWALIILSGCATARMEREGILQARGACQAGDQAACVDYADRLVAERERKRALWQSIDRNLGTLQAGAERNAHSMDWAIRP